MMGVLLSQEMKAKGDKLVLICALFVIGLVYHFYHSFKVVILLICVVTFCVLSCWVFFYLLYGIVLRRFLIYSSPILPHHIFIFLLISYLIHPYYHITSSLFLSILTDLITYLLDPQGYVCLCCTLVLTKRI